MSEVDLNRVAELGSASADAIGTSEEEVKINFVVPLLEALGHSRMKFEHHQKDIMLRTGPPRPMAVVVEAKRRGESLDRHVAQLERYVREEACFLAVLTNGDEIRLYAPPWPGVPSFEEALIWEVRRANLAEPGLARDLASCLSAPALASGEAAHLVAVCKVELDLLREKARRVREQAAQTRADLTARLAELQRRAAAIERERTDLGVALAHLDEQAEAAVAELYAHAGGRRPPILPAPSPGPRPAPTAESAAPRRTKFQPRPWNDDELFRDVSHYLRRALATFVRSGRRTLGTKEIAALAGLSPQQTHGALSKFTTSVRLGSREPFFEITKPHLIDRKATGVLYTILDKYWPTILRLYAPAEVASKNGGGAEP